MRRERRAESRFRDEVRLAFLLLVVASSCVRVATLEGGQPGESPCPSLRTQAKQIDELGTVTMRELTCRANEVCVEGDYACRCDVARGGAPRPNWWLCHRARRKPDGCPDDELLLQGAACSRDGQQCRAPRTCSCDDFNVATCERGHWTLGVCGQCLAP